MNVMMAEGAQISTCSAYDSWTFSLYLPFRSHSFFVLEMLCVLCFHLVIFEEYSVNIYGLSVS